MSNDGRPRDTSHAGDRAILEVRQRIDAARYPLLAALATLEEPTFSVVVDNLRHVLEQMRAVALHHELAVSPLILELARYQERRRAAGRSLVE